MIRFQKSASLHALIFSGVYCNLATLRFALLNPCIRSISKGVTAQAKVRWFKWKKFNVDRWMLRCVASLRGRSRTARSLQLIDIFCFNGKIQDRRIRVRCILEKLKWNGEGVACCHRRGLPFSIFECQISLLHSLIHGFLLAAGSTSPTFIMN